MTPRPEPDPPTPRRESLAREFWALAILYMASTILPLLALWALT